MAESTLGRAYRVLYEGLCGRHPSLRPWHSQWLAAHLLNRDLGEHLPKLTGRVLDVGCGDQPYRPLLRSAQEYVGADLAPGPTVDVVVKRGAPWPFPDERFDGLLMTQVMEYVDDVSTVVSEMRRVLKPGGTAVVSFPFLYNEHGPNDVLRLSAHAAGSVFVGFEPVVVKRQGAIGSTLGTLFLNWLNESMNSSYTLRMLRPVLLPIWLPLCLLVNMLSIIVNKLDRTGAYYSNVLVVLRREAKPTTGRADQSEEGGLQGETRLTPEP